jgi:hypothetical protein
MRFVDASAAAGIDTSGPAYGVAVADYDADGFEDLYFAAHRGRSALYRNRGDGTFEPATEQAGVAVAGEAVNPLWGDVDNDGDADLFVGVQSYTGRSSRLFLNNGDGTFADATASSGLDSSAVVGSAAFGDYDADGGLDLFVATRDSYDRLYRNTGDPGRRFVDIAGEVNVLGYPESIAMQATWADYDLDGRLDLLAVHDGNLAGRLYRQSSGYPRFQQANDHAGLAVARSAMGVAWGDYNNDGFPDVYVTNIAEANLFRNLGGGRFEDVTASTGTTRNGMGWGTVWADFDNDGDEDLFVGNTTAYDGTPAILYENRDGVFVDVAAGAGAAVQANVFGVAAGDFDGDGWLDLALATEGGSNLLLLNRSENAGAWLKVGLVGSSVNRMAVGARIRVVAGGVARYRVVDGGSSYCSQSSPILHIGLGQAARVDTLEVFWPDGSSQTFMDLPANTRYRVVQGGTVNVDIEPTPAATVSVELFPHPVTDRATLVVTLDEPAEVTIDLFDVIGRRVRTWGLGFQPAGRHTVFVDRETLSAGVYLVRSVVGRRVFMRPIVIAGNP